jgi:hypothetical protein
LIERGAWPSSSSYLSSNLSWTALRDSITLTAYYDARRLDAIEALIAASDELRAAQEAALAGGGGAELRAATTAEREAMRTITESAHELLSAGDQRPTAAMLERVASTLRTAARDPRGRELLVAGTLAEELEAAGFDALEGMRLPARRKPARRGGMQAGAAEERRREERLRKLRQKAEKLGAAAEDAEREAEKAEAEAARKRREAERAAAAAERAHSELGAAERTKPA